ncbi:Protein of unknown function [Lactobacillus delbrueckii subsp. lactis]|nr:Protein of unknown function [Lactobacillus delbrueckii subsp. lactis]
MIGKALQQLDVVA